MHSVEIQVVQDNLVEDSAFGHIEEEAIISLAIDNPEFFFTVGKFLKPEVFERAECQLLMCILHEYLDE